MDPVLKRAGDVLAASKAKFQDREPVEGDTVNVGDEVYRLQSGYWVMVTGQEGGANGN